MLFQVIQLLEDSYPSPRPCLKLKLNSATSNCGKKVHVVTKTHSECVIVKNSNVLKVFIWPVTWLLFLFWLLQRSHGNSGEVHTTAEVLLTTAQISADVTLLDRLQPLLTAPLRSRQVSPRSSSLEKIKHSLYMTSSNIHTIGLVSVTDMVRTLILFMLQASS